MSIVIQGKIPKDIILAYSGGPDSHAALLYLIYKGYRNVKCIFFNHGDYSSANAYDVVEENIASLNEYYLTKYKYSTQITLDAGNIQEYESKYKGVKVSSSQEDYWRTYRYLFFKDMYEKYKLNIITAHTLDDCVEEWIINAIIRGKQGVIPYYGPHNIFRPFRLNNKEALTVYIRSAHKKMDLEDDLDFHLDPENEKETHMRIFIRNNMKTFKTLNPGIYNMIRRKLLNDKNSSSDTYTDENYEELIDDELSRILP